MGLFIIIVLFIISIYYIFIYKKTPIKETFLIPKEILQNKENIIFTLPKNDATYYIDSSDLEYYNDVISEFEQRNTWYDQVKNKEPIVEDVIIINNIPNLVFNDDSQNVHDTVIQNYMKKSYKELDDNIVNKDSIEMYIQGHPRSNELREILNQIRDRNATLSNFNGDTEMEILNKVWSTANENVKSQLMNELLDSKNNYDGIYCPTGVATRIINATYIENPENLPKTASIIKEEMMNKASRVRDQITTDNKSDDEFTKEFKEKLLETYREDYKDILTEKQIDDYTKDWIDYI